MSIDGSFVIRFITYSWRYERELSISNICYMESHNDGFSLAKKLGNFNFFFSYITTTCRERWTLAHSFARSVHLQSQRDRQQQLHRKKFGGLMARETVSTNLDSWNFTTYRQDWRTFPSRAQLWLFTESILRDADCDRWHWTYFNPCPSSSMTFQVLHASEI